MSNNISIFLICDDNYAPCMATMIASICYNTNSNIEFHVIGKGISNQDKQNIQLMKENINNFDIDYKIFDVTFEDLKNFAKKYMNKLIFNCIRKNINPKRGVNG